MEQSSLKMFFKIWISEKQIRTCPSPKASEMFTCFFSAGFKILQKPLDVLRRQNSNGRRRERHGSNDLYPMPIHECLSSPPQMGWGVCFLAGVIYIRRFSHFCATQIAWYSVEKLPRHRNSESQPGISGPRKRGLAHPLADTAVWKHPSDTTTKGWGWTAPSPVHSFQVSRRHQKARGCFFICRGS